jgi:hypothetical protein
VIVAAAPESDVDSLFPGGRWQIKSKSTLISHCPLPMTCATLHVDWTQQATSKAPSEAEDLQIFADVEAWQNPFYTSSVYLPLRLDMLA